ncbi:MAG: type IV toxin-antitoxin system AbiEi family antitoxin domain-containing protein [Atopobium sp.]|nr:type IV toxin-antitoxin system AbiEi family antitoxin domain-containing protein [Atopobium sp.]
MAKIDDIYSAADDYGLVTSTDARALGVCDAEVVQYAARGRLERVARGVYRVPVWPYQVFLSISFFHVWHCCLSALAMKVFMFGKAYHIGYLAG